MSKVHVQAKLTVVSPEQLSTIVPLISRYANSQNKVNEADFEANDPFHVAIEKFSRSVWAPAAPGIMRQTKWFYERARGQYQDALGREPTPATKRRFKEAHPLNQKFTKTDLAKFENTWDQVPHIVSLGAEKSFRHFTGRLQHRGRVQVSQEYFERLVARAILFRRAEKIVSARNFGAYRANIVTYTVAYISKATAQRIDLDAIWQAQGISPTLEQAIDDVCGEVREVLLDAPGTGNITEWCKKPACWHRVGALTIPLPPQLQHELIDAVYDPWRLAELVIEALDRAKAPLGKSEVLRMTLLPQEAWMPTIRSLLESGRVVRTGDGRGSVYSLPSD